VLQYTYTAEAVLMDDFMSMSKLKVPGRTVTSVNTSGYKNKLMVHMYVVINTTIFLIVR